MPNMVANRNRELPHSGGNVADIRRSLLLSFAERYAGLALQLLSTLVLARLLTPEETGLFTVAVGVIAIAHMLRDFGTASYVIQSADVSLDRLRTVLTIACIPAYAVAAALFVSRHMIAQFFGQPEAASLLIILSCNFLVIPIGAIPLVLLRRSMRFQATFQISLASGIAHAAVAITLAYFEFGAMALALASLAGVCTTALMASAMNPIKGIYRPSLRHWREVFRFGAYSTGINLVEQVGSSAPDLIVGRMIGMSALGLFSRANGLVGLFTQLVFTAANTVALPALAQKLRDGQDAKPAFLRGMEYITAIGAVIVTTDTRKLLHVPSRTSHIDAPIIFFVRRYEA